MGAASATNITNIIGHHKQNQKQRRELLCNLISPKMLHTLHMYTLRSPEYVTRKTATVGLFGHDKKMSKRCIHSHNYVTTGLAQRSFERLKFVSYFENEISRLSNKLIKGTENIITRTVKRTYLC